MSLQALLLQLDGKIPNIALMRLSSYLKDEGYLVKLRRAANQRALESTLRDHASFDLLAGSLIFEKTRPLAESLRALRPDTLLGGTGWEVTSNLEAVGVPRLAPQDYTLYPDFHQSIGFTQRGCRLKCSFCVVPRKEGGVTEEQTIAELWRGEPWPKQLLLLDNDFFGQPHWRERVEEITTGRFKVSFNQGINARFLNEEVAAAIGTLDYRDDQMKERRLYTAWDNRKDEERLFRGLELLVANGVRPRHLMVYMLIGYWPGETHEDRDFRRARLRDFGALPYPMPYVRTPELVGFQRWVIGGYDKAIPWAEWVRARYQPRNLRRRAPEAPELTESEIRIAPCKRG